MRLLALLSLMWAVEVIPVDLGPGGDLLTNAVTIEGNASIEVTADTCVMEFVVFKCASEAGEAIVALKGARKGLETAVRTVIGASGRIEAGPPRISRKRREKERYFEARQTITARITSFPKGAVEFNEFVGKIAAGVAATGVVPDDLEYPAVTFEITRPGALEERFASMAGSRRLLPRRRDRGGLLRAFLEPAGPRDKRRDDRRRHLHGPCGLRSGALEPIPVGIAAAPPRDASSARSEEECVQCGRHFCLPAFRR
ncbi:MAG: SIMPL domain-containing protein [Planctomycetota bacterium]|jgi:hypothetical protein